MGLLCIAAHILNFRALEGCRSKSFKAVTYTYLINQKIKTALLSDLRKVPGPWYAPWTNLILKLQVIKGRRVHYIHALHLKYGKSPHLLFTNHLEMAGD